MASLNCTAIDGSTGPVFVGDSVAPVAGSNSLMLRIDGVAENKVRSSRASRLGLSDLLRTTGRVFLGLRNHFVKRPAKKGSFIRCASGGVSCFRLEKTQTTPN